MILENIKKAINKPEILLRYFLALIFLSAAIFRIFFKEEALKELVYLNLSPNLQIFLIVFEIIVGITLLFGKYIKIIYSILILFLIFALSWSFIFYRQNLILNVKELFVFNVNPTDWFLHFVFLVLAIFLLQKERRK